MRPHPLQWIGALAALVIADLFTVFAFGPAHWWTIVVYIFSLFSLWIMVRGWILVDYLDALKARLEARLKELERQQRDERDHKDQKDKLTD